MSPPWNANKQSTKQYYQLEGINRYEAETGPIADHVKIATIIKHLKGPIITTNTCWKLHKIKTTFKCDKQRIIDDRAIFSLPD
eukprot:2172254-Amphidinium_carterae.1